MPTPAAKPAPATPTPAAPAPAAPSTEPAVTPTQPSATEPTPEIPGMSPTPMVPAEPTTRISPQTSGVITVWVPFDAKVSINGLATRSTGSRRQYVSYGLKPGYNYKYDVVVQIVKNGQVVDEKKDTVVLTAGENIARTFGFNTSEAVASVQ